MTFQRPGTYDMTEEQIRATLTRFQRARTKARKQASRCTAAATTAPGRGPGKAG